MLKITVAGETREELIANLASWIDLLSGQRVGEQQLAPETPTESKKRGRPAKATTVEPDTLPLPLPMEASVDVPQAPVEPTGPPPAGHTLQSTIDALKAVASLRPGDTGPTDGYQRVGKILTKYGYKNVKEIKAEHYAAITSDCAVPA